MDAARRVEQMNWKPRNCVWELTLECNLRCSHCGSSAGQRRLAELDTDQCLGVVDELVELGCELVTLSGGEPTIHPGWDRIAAALTENGVLVNMITNGVYKGRTTATEIARRALAAGMCNLGVSIDGPREQHEAIRGKGTFAKSMDSVRTFVAAGMRVGIMTTVNRLNLPLLAETRQLAIDAGATMWRLQLAKPMGNMEGV